MTDLQLAPAEPDTDDLEVHFVCCHNHEIALCGAPLPAGDGWRDVDVAETTCVDCDLVEMNHRCPVWGWCAWYG